jgi:hypothetical protein
LSFGFIGQNIQAYDYIPVIIEDLTDDSTEAYQLTEDGSNQRVYIEFVTPSNSIRLIDIPIDIAGDYEAMLYKGDYASFPGFEPYLLQSEVLSYQGVLLVNYDYLWTSSDISNLIVPKDPYDGIIPIEVVEDTYTLSDKKPGKYEITFKTTYNQISKVYHLDIVVYDITSPVLSLEESFLIPLTEKIDVSEIISTIHITDNVDTLTHDHIEIIEDTYTSAVAVGDYHIKVSIKDQSQNIAYLTIPVSVIDKKAPEALFPYNLFVYNTDIPLTNEYIMSKFVVTDDVDGSQVEKTWISNQYNQTLIPGIYTMELSTKDGSNNVSIHKIYIHVVDNQAPQFSIDELIISTESHQQMTNSEIIEWFYSQASHLGVNVSHVRIIYNEYEMAEQEEGSYYVYVSYLSGDEEKTARILMQVEDQRDTSSMVYYGIGVAIMVSLMGMYVIKKKKI